MQIPSFVDLKKHIDQDERAALRLLLEAALGKQPAQIKTMSGQVVDGYLNLQTSPKVSTFFGALLDRIK